MGGIVSGFFGGGGDDASDAAAEASRVSAQGQREALNYLKSSDRIPRKFREGSLSRLGGLYGLEGGEGSQSEFIEEAKQSPLYKFLIGSRAAGEEAILRNASATGGLRSGNVQENLYDYNTQLSNSALLESYNQRLGGLQDLSRLPSNANSIASTMAGIGQTQAQGITAGAQAQQAGNQQGINNIMGLAGLAGSFFSDIRLKENIGYIGEENGHSWFEWDWNDRARELGLLGHSQGVMAHLVHEYCPEAIGVSDGFIVVDYDMLGVQ